MKKILFVDSDAALLDLYEEEFTEDGYEVIVARDGKEALRKYRENNPHLMVTDPHLSDKNSGEPGIKGKGESTMSEKEYKQFSCRAIGVDCDFLVRAATKEETMRLATEHACEAHKICEIIPEFKDKVDSSIRDIWCQAEQCGYVAKEPEIPYIG